jgi:type IV pilus assembly protein PilC
MPTYSFTARDRNGNPIQDVIISADVDTVREQLRERDLFLISVTPQGVTEERRAGQSRIWSRRVRIGEMVVLSRQIATLVRAGLPINEALHTVAQQTENPYLSQMVQRVRRDILSGSSFTEAVARHPDVFSELYVALIRAGETGGVLEETLETAADHLDKEAELREKVKAAFTYPLVVLVVAIAVVAFLVFVIIPQFATFYAAFGTQLPAITLLLLRISTWMFNPWFDLTLILIIGGTVVGIRRYISTPRGGRRWDDLKLRMWPFGRLNRKIATARFTRALSAMVRAGVPILQALTISARVANNAIINEAVMRVAEFVQQGARLWMPMEQTGQFPPIVTRMIAAGEESGNLDEMLSELSRFYERDIEYAVQKLTRLVEPMLTVLVGGIVLFVLLALYMPIFSLTNVLKLPHH